MFFGISIYRKICPRLFHLTKYYIIYKGKIKYMAVNLQAHWFAYKNTMKDNIKWGEWIWLRCIVYTVKLSKNKKMATLRKEQKREERGGGGKQWRKEEGSERRQERRKGIAKWDRHPFRAANAQFRKCTKQKCKRENLFSLRGCRPQSIWTH